LFLVFSTIVPFLWRCLGYREIQERSYQDWLFCRVTQRQTTSVDHSRTSRRRHSSFNHFFLFRVTYIYARTSSIPARFCITSIDCHKNRHTKLHTSATPTRTLCMEQPNGSASSHPEHDPAQSTDDNADDGPPMSPPYWQRGNSILSETGSSSQHTRNKANRLSGPIRLHDNSDETENDQARACWAKSARINDYVIVSGSVSRAGLGSYVVWNCTIETLNVSTQQPSSLVPYTWQPSSHVTYASSLEVLWNYGFVELTDACLTGSLVQDTQTLLRIWRFEE
jgi:hypothetical protein